MVGAVAFGAHALKARLSFDALAVWETAVRYQTVHALALTALAPRVRPPAVRYRPSPGGRPPAPVWPSRPQLSPPIAETQ